MERDQAGAGAHIGGAGRSDQGGPSLSRDRAGRTAARFEAALLSARRTSARDEERFADALDFLRTDPLAFERSNPARHFTGSAFVVDPSRTLVLLTLHAKLGRWLQLGGHCDGVRDPFFVAWKEAYEESGLKEIRPDGEGILDLSIHMIPEHKGVPEHLHYDVRYLFVADPTEPLAITDESLDLKWVPLDRIQEYAHGRSLIDMRGKLRALGSEGRP